MPKPIGEFIPGVTTLCYQRIRIREAVVKEKQFNLSNCIRFTMLSENLFLAVLMLSEIKVKHFTVSIVKWLRLQKQYKG